MNDWQCKNCLYWRRFDSSPSMPNMGFCERYPPRVLAMSNGANDDPITYWPETAEDDRCGEFKRPPK